MTKEQIIALINSWLKRGSRLQSFFVASGVIGGLYVLGSPLLSKVILFLTVAVLVWYNLPAQRQERARHSETKADEDESEEGGENQPNVGQQPYPAPQQQQHPAPQQQPYPAPQQQPDPNS
jgi:hypothetical protein